MKKAKRFDRKNLKNRLSCIMMIYLDGLSDKKKEKMKKYLDEKLIVVVDHYVTLLNKKNLKMINTNVTAEQIEKLCPEFKKAADSANISTENPEKSKTEELIPQ
jgi:hypothetical protein